MLDVNIFIASSFEMADWREAIGHAIGVFSEEWEPRGYRIRMKCWEDYHPEFDGERKQDQYNRDLVQKSQIFVALFGERCGAYTQEEVRLGKSHCADDLYVLRRSGTVSDAVDQFLDAEGLEADECAIESEVTERIRKYIETYIAKHATNGNAMNQEQRIIYGTIPDDCKEYRSQFGNMVRSLDDMMCDNANLRCRLRMDAPDQVCQSNYYAAILKDTISLQDEQELVDAISHVSPSALPDKVQLYADYDNKAITDSPALNALIQSKGLFPEAFQGNMFHVRYNLFRWLLRSLIIKVDEQAGLNVRDGMLTFFNMPIISVESLKIKAGSKAELVSQVIRQISFSILCDDATSTKSPEEVIDLDQLDSEVETNAQMLLVAADVEGEAINKLENQRQHISARITYLNQSEEIRSQHIEELSALSISLAKVQRQLLAHGRGDAHDLLRTLMLTVQMHDTYTPQFLTLGYDINAHYQQMSDTADEYHIFDPTIEMMRMNYANYLHRQNRNREALTFYETAMAHINEFDDRSELMRRYIMHLYVTYTNFVSSLGENQRAFDAITKLTQKETAWEKQGLTEVESIANHCQILACQLRIRPLEGKVFDLLNQAMHTYQKACAIPHEEFDPSIRMDVFCDLPNCIAATTIDAGTYFEMPDDWLKHNVDYFLGKVVDYAEKHREEPHSMLYLSEALHNWAFFYSDQKGDQTKAREICEKALAVRRHLYSVTKQPDTLYEVAQTLLLLGATYVNDIHGTLNEADFQAAMRYAEECLSLYESLNQEHYLEHDTQVHEAIQLKGSILYYGGRIDEGLALLKKAWDWNLSHPGNNYVARFRGVSGEILKKEGII